MKTVTIRLRSMQGRYSTDKLFLEDGNNFLVPPLSPGEVVEVPSDHSIFESDGSVHLEVCKEKANRPYAFKTLSDVMAYGAVDADFARAQASKVLSSAEQSARTRQENRDAVAAEAKKEASTGEPVVTAKMLDAADAEAGLGPVEVNAQLAPAGRRRGKK